MVTTASLPPLKLTVHSLKTWHLNEIVFQTSIPHVLCSLSLIPPKPAGLKHHRKTAKTPQVVFNHGLIDYIHQPHQPSTEKRPVTGKPGKLQRVVQYFHVDMLASSPPDGPWKSPTAKGWWKVSESQTGFRRLVKTVSMWRNVKKTQHL